MRKLLASFLFVAFIAAFSNKAEAQTIPEQIQETLESEDTVVNTILYVKRYYLDSNDLIEDLEPVRSDMEWYIFERMPEKFPGRNITYLEESCDSGNEYTTFLNSGGQQYPICFSTVFREGNDPPNNFSEKNAVDVRYKFTVKLTW